MLRRSSKRVGVKGVVRVGVVEERRKRAAVAYTP